METMSSFKLSFSFRRHYRRRRDSMEEDDQDSYENRLARLREKHGGPLADFKLKCWAKMLVSLDNKK